MMADPHAELRQQLREAIQQASQPVLDAYRPRIERAAERGDGPAVNQLRLQMTADLEFATAGFTRQLALLPAPPVVISREG